MGGMDDHSWHALARGTQHERPCGPWEHALVAAHDLSVNLFASAPALSRYLTLACDRPARPAPNSPTNCETGPSGAERPLTVCVRLAARSYGTTTRRVDGGWSMQH